MKKGFTLVELIATIGLLALLALIISPLIIGTIENQKLKSFELSIKGIMDAVKKDAEMDKFIAPREYTFGSGELTLTKKEGVTITPINITFDGKIDNGSGTINYNNDGTIGLKIKTNKFCGKKAVDGNVTVSKKLSECN